MWENTCCWILQGKGDTLSKVVEYQLSTQWLLCLAAEITGLLWSAICCWPVMFMFRVEINSEWPHLFPLIKCSFVDRWYFPMAPDGPLHFREVNVKGRPLAAFIRSIHRLMSWVSGPESTLWTLMWCASIAVTSTIGTELKYQGWMRWSHKLGHPPTERCKWTSRANWDD